MRFARTALLALGCTVGAFSTAAAADPSLKCVTGKLKEAGKYGQCRAATQIKAFKSGGIADFSKCATKFTTKWGKLEAAAAGACPSSGDVAIIEALVSTHVTMLADAVLTGDWSVVCAFPATGQTQDFGPGSDGAVRAGAPLTFNDNLDGTITDLNTGLMWEKKVSPSNINANCVNEGGSCANPHDYDNIYTWTNDSPQYNGTVVTIFLDQLNNGCHSDPTVFCSAEHHCALEGLADHRCGFAGYRDWRLPNVKELLTITNHGTFTPAVHGAFNGASCSAACTNATNPACSCTREGAYWSSTSESESPANAWSVDYGYGYLMAPLSKAGARSARAVRGGL